MWTAQLLRLRAKRRSLCGRPSCLQLLPGHLSDVGTHGRWSGYPEVFERWCSCPQVHGVATGFIVGNFFQLSRLALTVNGSIHHSFDVARSSGTLWGPHMFFLGTIVLKRILYLNATMRYCSFLSCLAQSKKGRFQSQSSFARSTSQALFGLQTFQKALVFLQGGSAALDNVIVNLLRLFIPFASGWVT